MSVIDALDLMWYHFWEEGDVFTAIVDLETTNQAVPGTAHDWMDATESRAGLPHRKLFSSFDEDEHWCELMELYNAWSLSIRGMHGAVQEARAREQERVNAILDASCDQGYREWAFRRVDTLNSPAHALRTWTRRQELMKEKALLFAPPGKKRERLPKWERDREDARDDKRWKQVMEELAECDQ